MSLLKPCQLLAKHTIDNKIIHYHAKLDDGTQDIEILEKYKGRTGFFMKKYLIGAEYNMNDWRTPWSAIKKDVWGFEGKPVVLTPARDHPSVAEQDDYAVGEIIEVGLDETKQIAWQVSQIFDKKAQKLIREKKVRYGSPTVMKYSDATTVETKLGNDHIQTTLNRFIPAHDALVEDPAYGKQVDYIPAVCDGSGVGCSLKLMEVSASVNSDNTDQLTIVPFVKKALTSNYKSKTLREMVQYSKRTRQGSSSNDNNNNNESCISRKISILADEHQDWANDQIIATAYAYCKKGKSAEIEKMILTDLTPAILHIQKKISETKKLADVVEDLGNHLQKLKA